MPKLDLDWGPAQALFSTPLIDTVFLVDADVILYSNCHSELRCSLIFIAHQHTDARFSQNSDGVTPCGSAKYRWGIKISRFSTNKSLYLANDTRYRHSYYGRRIRTSMRSIKWCHFQWSWTNPNPAFKVTPLFDGKYLTNGYRYGHSYYRRRIGNRTQAFEWHQFQWSWVTSNPDFKVTILFNVK